MALSEQLTDLAARVKNMEDAVQAAREKNTARLEQQKKTLEAKAAATKVEAESRWSETTTKIDKGRADLKAKFEQHKAERTVAAAKRYADGTEDQALMLVSLAEFAVDAAAEAVIDAAIAEDQYEAMTKENVKVGS